MSRPKSMSDFAALIDTTTPPLRELPRKKPSISLAAGLIMAAEGPRSGPGTPQIAQHPRSEAWSENLFYAYARMRDYAHAPPYILTFASATVCEQWWSLVQRECPESSRTGPQLFILDRENMLERIQDNPRFHDLRNRWFYTASDRAGPTGVIPIQDRRGQLVIVAPTPAPPPPQESGHKPEPLDMTKLTAALDKMSSMIVENSAQIRALAVAQSEGLRRMQEINESNSSQIKALADSQAKLHSLVSDNASHYIALSNSSFGSTETIKKSAIASTSQIMTLAEGQVQIAKSCEGMMRTIESLGHSVSQINDSIHHMSTGMSDTASIPSSSIGSGGAFGAMANRISPPPRKLNRRIKGVWYEYDDGGVAVLPRKGSMTAGLDTPPKSSHGKRGT